ncbi:MAG: hypothetical protein G01um101425_531 [Candidatus Peregrinibacteria bacterium Gr01-1014_25]|nr:MAG: hypothetical protein G01um101425_531 [Candidatus Peregrinibacteria bacterium Gr01-1014_25]
MLLKLPQEPSQIATTIVRISFGVSLMFVALAHFSDLQSFSLVVSDGLEFLGPLPRLWAYIQPSLMLFGGALLAINRFPILATWCAGVALAVIPVGMLSKTIFGLDLADMMASAINAWIWLLIFLAIVKMTAPAKS